MSKSECCNRSGELCTIQQHPYCCCYCCCCHCCCYCCRSTHWSLAIICHPKELGRVLAQAGNKRPNPAETAQFFTDVAAAFPRVQPMAGKPPPEAEVRAVERLEDARPCIIFLDSLSIHSSGAVCNILRGFVAVPFHAHTANAVTLVSFFPLYLLSSSLPLPLSLPLPIFLSGFCCLRYLRQEWLNMFGMKEEHVPSIKPSQVPMLKPKVRRAHHPCCPLIHCRSLPSPRPPVN